jgi:hypothetical protein
MQKARRHPKAPTACKRMVSGTISLCCSQYFSPFPYGTGSLSVTNEYLALPDGAGCFTQDFSGPALLRILLVHNFFTYRAFTSIACFSTQFGFRRFLNAVLQPPAHMEQDLGSSPFARHYSGNHYYFLFLRVLRCFSSPGWPLSVIHLQCIGFSHSDIYGSMLVCSSP